MKKNTFKKKRSPVAKPAEPVDSLIILSNLLLCGVAMMIIAVFISQLFL